MQESAKAAITYIRSIADEYQLEEDDALYFDASVPHSYVNREEQTAKIVMLIQYL